MPLITWRLLHQSFIHSQSFNVELARPENLTRKFENICLFDEKKKKKKKKMKTGRLSRHSFYSFIYSHLKHLNPILLNESGECWAPLHSHVIIPKPHWRCHSAFPVWLQDWWDGLKKSVPTFLKSLVTIVMTSNEGKWQLCHWHSTLCWLGIVTV